jgi:hypothetical protein
MFGSDYEENVYLHIAGDACCESCMRCRQVVIKSVKRLLVADYVQ